MIPRFCMLNSCRLQPLRQVPGLAVLSVCLLIFGLLAWPEGTTPSSSFKPAASASGSLPELRGPAAVERLKQEGWYSSLAAAMAAARYQFVWETRPLLGGIGPAYHAPNPAQGFQTYFTREGLRLAEFGPRRDEPAGRAQNPNWRLALKLKGIGYGERREALSLCGIEARQSRIEYTHYPAVSSGSAPSAITEWYLNRPDGLEQGFTISAPPGPASGGQPLRLALEIGGDLRAEMSADGQAISLRDPRKQTSLHYRDLKAWDARGQDLPARMRLEGNEIALEVDDAGAVYPLTIDPLLSQQAKLTASDGAAGDLLGFSVAISGDTAVVGAEGDDVGANVDQGSAYVFVRSGTSWTQQQRLIAGDGAAGDSFGQSVAISGDTAVVGALSDNVGANVDQGSAYVFVRSGTSWTQQQRLTASDGAAGDSFGQSVAISGDTAVVGAHFDDAGANTDQGSAYVFMRSGTSWTQQQKLTAGDGAALDNFGLSVAISGDTVVVGAYLDDVGVNVYQGSAYVFVRSGTSWTQQQKLAAGDGAANDQFGFSVAISGDTAVVGARFDGVGANPIQGSAYVFVRSGTSWTQQQRLIAGDGATFDSFGSSVALSGNTVVVGASLDDVGANANQGSAYVFVVCGDLIEQQKLTDGDGAEADLFGESVAISGDTAVVGARSDDVGANANQGSAFIFVRSGTSWTQQQQLTAGDGAAGDSFGFSVAISGDTTVVGARFDDVGANADQGSAFVFVRSGTSWTQQQRLTASDGAAFDNFGQSVAISGDTAVVGAVNDDVGANVDQGSAYVFVRSGTSWTQQQKLTASDGAAGDSFGFSVAISGDTAVVGAEVDDVGANVDQGSAYVFVRTRTGWTQQQKLIASDGAAVDLFGLSVAISGDTVVVGAVTDDIGANANQGSAYVFVCGGCPAITLDPATLLNGAPGAPYNQSLTASGGSEPYRFSLSTGSLPPGLTLSQGGQISGTPVAAGTYNFTITATAANLCTGSRSYTLVINCLGLTVNPAVAALPAGTVGTPYSRTFTAVGGAAPYTFSVTSGILPGGLSLSPGGVLTGSPLANGVFSFTVRARDVNNCEGSQTYTVTINTGPTARVIRVAPASGSPGNTVAVPIELVSQGNENALGLSLNFDPAVLGNPRPALGGDATGAMLNFNTSQAASGRLGLTLALSSNTTFSAGVRRVFVVTFDIAAGVTARSTPIEFGDQPLIREVVSATVALFPANYPPGVVTITPGLEADVAPRSDGNGAVTVLDWVQAGRFAARLDTAASGSEFQRADCAPIGTKGDGALTVADWVQAGRYAAGLDPPVPVGGPTAPVAPLTSADCRMRPGEESSSCNPLLAFGATAKPPSRLISVSSAPESGAITLALDARGDENALGLSLIFNPSQWRYVSATPSHDAAGAALQINTSHAARGRLGLALALPASRTFEAGAQQLIALTFALATGDGQPPALAVGLADAPVEREVVAANARVLAARFAVEMSGGALGWLTSVSAASFRDGDLAREQIVAAFGANLATQTATVSELPLPTDLIGVRVVVTDSRGVARPAPLFFVSPTQINYQIPPETADGVASVAIIYSHNTVAAGVAAITPVSPALFTADASGAGPPAATLLRVDPAGNLSYEAVARFDPATNRFTPVPINLGAEGEEVFLLLYGTGVRGRSQLGAIRCSLGGVAAEVSYAGEATGFVGLDQLNVKLPRALTGRGDVEVVLQVDGVAANAVRVNIR